MALTSDQGRRNDQILHVFFLGRTIGVADRLDFRWGEKGGRMKELIKNSHLSTGKRISVYRAGEDWGRKGEGRARSFIFGRIRVVVPWTMGSKWSCWVGAWLTARSADEGPSCGFRTGSL